MKYLKLFEFWDGEEYNISIDEEFIGLHRLYKNLDRFPNEILDEVDYMYLTFYNTLDSEYKTMEDFLPTINSDYKYILDKQQEWDKTYTSRLMVIFDEFYKKNIKCFVDNIKWKAHPIAKGMENFTDEESKIFPVCIPFKNTKMAVLPNGFSLIKGLSLSDDEYEFWPKEKEEEPIRLSASKAELQYYLYKYMTKKTKW